GASGMNSRGVAVLSNTFDQLSNCDDGLPLACGIRGGLSRKNMEDGERVFLKIEQASGQKYLICGSSGVAGFECSAGKVTRHGGSDVVWHTNHPLTNDDFTPQWAAVLKSNPAAIQAGSSCVRFDSIARRVQESKSTLTMSDLTAILRSRDSAQ